MFFGWNIISNVQYVYFLSFWYVLYIHHKFVSFLQRMDNKRNDHPSPRSTSVSVPDLADCYLSGGIKTSLEVGTVPPSHIKDSDFEITISNLPYKLSFFAEFQAELEAEGGNIESFSVKMLQSPNLDDKGQFWQDNFFLHLNS